jgi:hypothetical protein
VPRKPRKPRRSKWMVIRTIWPYKDGYGTYCWELTGLLGFYRRRIILDTGLTLEEAQAAADKLNRGDFT